APASTVGDRPAAAPVFRDRFAGRIAPACLDAIDHFAAHADSIVRELPDGATLIHGEPRVDNVLFEDLADGHRAWLIDWQFADRGSPMFDLAYFLAGSVSPEDRRAIEDELIAAHQAVISTVDPGYSLDRARAEFKACLPIALHFSAGAVMAVPAGDAEDRLLMTLVERNVAALTDWQCFRP
ncbi:MAG TPA: phosphotransferase, partial [Polymorphobacter sp.]|nr:phosphotransferase [Polymorphobacter sp.]